MKKLYIIFVLLAYCNVSYSANEWTNPSFDGTESPSIVDTEIAADIQDPLQRLLAKYRRDAYVKASSSSQVKIAPGEITCSNSAATTFKMRQTTSDTTVTFSELDTGSEEASQNYFVWADCDADATTFTGALSESSSFPTGITSAALLGYFYNNSSSNIIQVSNVPNGNTQNRITVHDSTNDTLNDTSYGSDVTGTSVYFYTSGKVVTVLANLEVASTPETSFIVDVAGTDKTDSEVIFQGASTGDENTVTLLYSELLSAGAYEIKIQGKVASGSATVTEKTIMVWEG